MLLTSAAGRGLRRENSKLKRQLVNHRDLVREINKELAGAHTTVLGIKKQKEMLEVNQCPNAASSRSCNCFCWQNQLRALGIEPVA